MGQEALVDSLYTAYQQQGNEAWQSRGYDSAIYFFQLALQTPIADSLRNQTIYTRLGDAYYYSGDFQLSLDCYLRALNMLLIESDSVGLIYAYYNVGFILQQRRDYTQSLDYLFKSLELEILYNEENSSHVADCYNMIGLAYHYSREHEQALVFLQRGLSIRLQQYGDMHSATAGSYNNLGLAYNQMKQYEKAISYFERATDIRIQTLGPIHAKVAGGHLNMGSCYKDMQKYQKALFHFQKALKIYKADLGQRHPKVSLAYGNIAATYSYTGDYQQQLIAAHQALVSIGDQFGDEDPYQQPALLQLPLHITTVTALLFKGKAMMKLFEQEGHKKDIVAAYEVFELGIGCLDQLESLSLSKQASQQWQEHGIDFFRGGLDACLILYGLERKKKWLERAFEITESGKATLLHQELLETKAKLFAEIPPDLLQQEIRWKRRIGELEKQIFLLQQSSSPDSHRLFRLQSQLLAPKDSLRRLSSMLKVQYPLYHRWAYASNIPPLTDMQTLLPDSTHLMIEYMFGLEHLYAFVIGKDQIYIRQLNTDSLRSRIFAMQQLLREPKTFLLDGQYMRDLSRFQQLGNSLYRDLLQEIVQAFPHVTHLSILPDRYLGYLPFEVLLSAPADGTSYRIQPFLLKSYVIRYEFSATILHHMHTQKTRKRGIWAGFAPSRIDGDSLWTPLPHSQTEVRHIQDITTGKAYLGQAATESAFKAGQSSATILHMATHAYTDDEHPAFSAMILADESQAEEDGILYAYEIYQSQIPAEMVVLSACNTGFGPLSGGEGVMSLARAFKSAGCPNVVMSLWSVDDERTTQLMTRFYHYLNLDLPKDQALRQAKLDMIQASPQAHPHYWASFVLIGDHEEVRWQADYSWIYPFLICSGGLLLILLLMTLYSRIFPPEQKESVPT